MPLARLGWCWRWDDGGAARVVDLSGAGAERRAGASLRDGEPDAAGQCGHADALRRPGGSGPGVGSHHLARAVPGAPRLRRAARRARAAAAGGEFVMTLLEKVKKRKMSQVYALYTPILLLMHNI